MTCSYLFCSFPHIPLHLSDSWHSFSTGRSYSLVLSSNYSAFSTNCFMNVTKYSFPLYAHASPHTSQSFSLSSPCSSATLTSATPSDSHSNSKNVPPQKLAQEPKPIPDYGLMIGQVVEAWVQKKLVIGIIKELFPTCVLLHAPTSESSSSSASSSASESQLYNAFKVSYEELITSWPTMHQVQDITQLSEILKKARYSLAYSVSPRALSLSDIYQDLSTGNKDENFISSLEVSGILFSSTVPNRKVAIAMAAMLLASNSFRFKRRVMSTKAGIVPMGGYKALPKSVTRSKVISDFVDIVKAQLWREETSLSQSQSEIQAENSPFKDILWSKDHVDLIRAIELQALSQYGHINSATSTILQCLDLPQNLDGAKSFLKLIHWWNNDNHLQLPSSSSADNKKCDKNTDISEITRDSINATSTNNNITTHTDVDWAFSSTIGASSKEIKHKVYKARASYLKSISSNFVDFRHETVFCVDPPGSKFLDDAFSVSMKTIKGKKLIAANIHVANVDRLIAHDLKLDNLAKERGEVIYLPDRVLHMLPPSLMECASFDETLPNEAITVEILIDPKTNRVVASDIFESIVPPVIKFTVEDFNEMMGSQSKNAIDLEALNQLASVILAMNLSKDRGINSPIASVKMVPGGNSSDIKTAQITTFDKSVAQRFIDGILRLAGQQIRKFADANGAPLPELPGAELFALRCGTAPLRKYSDLIIQRQVSAVLRDQPLMSKKEMTQLSYFLSQRHEEKMKLIHDRRQMALLESLSEHCKQQMDSSGNSQAILKGTVRSISTRNNVEILLESAGLIGLASVNKAQKAQLKKGSRVNVAVEKIEFQTRCVRLKLMSMA